MKINAQLRSVIISLDERLARNSLALTHEQDSLLCFLFHGLFESQAEAQSGMIDPQQGVTVEMFRVFLNHFREQNYGFVSPQQILSGLDRGGRYILLTFDDGYYNNLRALQLLEEFAAPAVFFISSNHIQHGKAFWWDVAYREGHKRGRTNDEIRRTVAGYKQWKTAEVESEMRRELGPHALRPAGDLDRPLTPDELREFAKHPLVSLGNHTKDHAILTNYSPAEMKEQIQSGQNAIRQITGTIPQMISYPNGNTSPEIQAAAREAGLRLGVVARGGKNRLPLGSGTPAAMALKRFTLWGDRAIDSQCRASRSAVSVSRILSGFQARAGRAMVKARARFRSCRNALAYFQGDKKGMKQSDGVGTKF